MSDGKYINFIDGVYTAPTEFTIQDVGGANPQNKEILFDGGTESQAPTVFTSDIMNILSNNGIVALTLTGAANTYTAVIDGLLGLTDDVKLIAKVSASNTGASTIVINDGTSDIATVDIVKNTDGSTVSLASGDLDLNAWAFLQYDSAINDFVLINPNVDVTQLQLDVNQLQVDVQGLEDREYKQLTATGTDVYIATLLGFTAYTSETKFIVVFANTNTGASTLNVESVGVVNLKKISNNVKSDLSKGNIQKNVRYEFIYDGLDFVLSDNSLFNNVIDPIYDTTSDLSLFRQFLLTGNIGGALTQTVSGESAINLLGNIGGFYKDSNDNKADGFTFTNTTSESLLNQIQAFTAAAQFGLIETTATNISEDGDVYYIRAEIETSKSTVRLSVGGTATEVAHTGSGDFEILSLLYTADATDRRSVVYESDAGSFSEIRVKKWMVLNLTNEGDGSLSLAQADLKYAKYFDNIGHATINQKITGANGEFELKEPFVLPKDPAGGTDGTSEIVTLDGQNFARIKHELRIANGELNWTGFDSATYTNHAFAFTADIKDGLVSASGTGVGVNNDYVFPYLFGSSDEPRMGIDGTNGMFALIPKSELSALTLDAYKEYLNNRPMHCLFRKTTSVDIPIKHLASIEDGTWENNSTILPSAITLTYPTNEAAERESSQIAQNQITTVDSHPSQEFRSTFDTTGNEIARRGFGNNVDFVYDNQGNNILIITPIETIRFTYDSKGNNTGGEVVA